MSNYRCVVTGRNAEGKSIVVRDELVPTRALGCADFWKTASSPAELTAEWSPESSVQLEPPPGGTIFRFFEIPASNPQLDDSQANKAAEAAFATAGGSHCRVDTRRHAMMHTTSTIDYVVVLRGQVMLLLDQEEVELKPFDVVVQRGANHYWINRAAEPALLMGVLLDAH